MSYMWLPCFFLNNVPFYINASQGCYWVKLSLKVGVLLFVDVFQNAIDRLYSSTNKHKAFLYEFNAVWIHLLAISPFISNTNQSHREGKAKVF